MSDTAQQTPAQELMDRALEHAPARTVPFLIGLRNMQNVFALKHQKDREDYAFEKKLRGDMTEGEVPNAEPEEMGDITVAGDTTTTNVHHHYHAPQSEPSMLKKALPYALAAALGAGGAMLPALWNRLPQVTDTDTNTQYTIEALPGE